MTERFMLVVEDDPDDEDLMRRALDEAGAVGVAVVRDGQEALDYLFCEGDYADRDPAAMPIAVILDLKLPKLSGVRVLERLRADPRTARLPVVMLTSSTEAEEIAACYDAGATSYVYKPVDFAEFNATIAQLAGYWGRLNLTPARR